MATLTFPAIPKAAGNRLSLCWKLGLYPHFSFKNMRTVGLDPPFQWWTDDWSRVEHPVETESEHRAKLVEKWKTNKIPGQTYLMLVESDRMNNVILASYLGFARVTNMMTWMDTQATEIIGHFGAYRAVYIQERAAMQWSKIYQLLRKARENESASIILSAVGA
ncbi:hypothetical protein GQ53DRAFT_834929 [Thozetella sp. PMI_491]|nr:hypothetical protein GQ53DRAFT_834929 [Thozetella sp. PMI_491]